MATVQDKSVLQNAIQTDLADNNAGLISAEDVRENMDNIVESISHIVANSNMNSVNPFQNSVRAQMVGGSQGLFIAESGVQFPSLGAGTAQNNYNTQIVPYPGNDGVDHNLLANLTIGDVHTQYLNVMGQRQMQGNLGLDTYWLNSEGNSGSGSSDNKGLKFTSVDTDNETMHIGEKTTIEFDSDHSKMNSAKGVAKAWLTFDASSGGSISVNSSFNIASIERGIDPASTNASPGIFIINFKNSIPTPYVAIGQSNGTSNNLNAVDFDYNVVAIVERTSTYLTFVVRNDHGAYVDAKLNDLVVFGLSDANEEADELVTTTPAP